MRKHFKIIAIMLIFAIFALASSSAEKDIIGKWYDDEGDIVDVRKDGTFDDPGYGTGTWKLLDDGSTYEFIDYYGESQEVTIESDEYGEYIRVKYYGKFYKDGYPDISDDYSKDFDEINTTTEQSYIKLDPFENISYEVSGISPYCKLTINNAGCSDEVQKNVTYSFDKDEYANGETAVITAKLYNGTNYILTKTETSFKIENQPEYIKSIDKNIISVIQKELDDFVTANVAEAVKTGQNGYATSNLLGCNVSVEMKSVDSIEQKDIYFSLLKSGRDPKFYYYNLLTFTYQASFTGKYESGTVYSCIYATNIIKYPDGTIKWGLKNADALDFYAEGTQNGGMENCVNTLLMSRNADYNISKIEN